MAGLVPAIHVFTCGAKIVDARDKPGHDALLSAQIILKVLHLPVAFVEQNRAWRVICANLPRIRDHPRIVR
jgi:hypothetical protein